MLYRSRELNAARGGLSWATIIPLIVSAPISIFFLMALNEIMPEFIESTVEKGILPQKSGSSSYRNDCVLEMIVREENYALPYTNRDIQEFEKPFMTTLTSYDCTRISQ